jgi:DNA topoisomerase-2
MHSADDIAIIRKYALDKSVTDHIENKSMWLGSVVNGAYPAPIYDAGSVIIRYVEHTPAWYKSIDELLTNAIDRCIEGHANKINISFDGLSFMIENNGNGFDVVRHPLKTEMYMPEYLFTSMFSGTQLEKGANNISGGTNGLGIKLCCTWAKLLMLTTVDSQRQLLYMQSFQRKMALAPPVVTDLRGGPVLISALKRQVNAFDPFTLIYYMPDIEKFGMARDESSGSPRHAENYVKMLMARVYSVSIYLNCAIIAGRTTNSVTVHYNGGKVSGVTKSLEEYIRWYLGPKENVKIIGVTLSHSMFPWEVAAVIMPNSGTALNVAIINGLVIMQEKCEIFVYIRERILAHARKYFTESLNKVIDVEDSAEFKQCYDMVRTQLNSSLSIFVVGAIPNPQWGSQEKTTLIVTREYCKAYILSDEWKDAICVACKSIVEYTLFKHREVQISKVLRETLGIEPKNYVPALGAGKHPRGTISPCMLFSSEGQSATTLISNMIEQLKLPNCGIYDLKGVPINARKQMISHTMENGEKKYQMSKILAKNEVLQGLVKLLNLQYGLKYDTVAERSTLNYGRLIIATDQDLDGTGKISPLVQSFIELFWPALYASGFIQQLTTPLIVVLNKKDKSVEAMFDYDQQFEEWAKPRVSEMHKYIVEYKKGLASHSKPLIPHIFRNLEHRIMRISPNPEIRSVMNLLYNEDTAPRKKLLSTALEPGLPAPPTYITQDGRMSNADDFDAIPHIDSAILVLGNAKAFSLDNLRRLLPGPDGLYESGRKAIATIRSMKWPTNHLKFSAVAGHVVARMGYAHGEVGLAQTLCGMSQYYPGAKVIPFLVPNGMIGSRGTDLNPDVRYTHTYPIREIIDLLFPKEDDSHLTYDMDEGRYYEPRYYVPMDCLNIAEYFNNPSTGWRVVIWPRAHVERIANIICLIDHSPDTGFTPESVEGVSLAPMPPNFNGFTGEYFIGADGREWMIGTYSFAAADPNKNTVIITELPINVRAPTYCKNIIEKFGPTDKGGLGILAPVGPKEMKGVHNASSSLINITIYFLPGWRSKLVRVPPDSGMDPLAYNLDLCEPVYHFVNIINENNFVTEYGSNYEKPLRHWFNLRTNLWYKRIERRQLILRGTIDLLKNKLRFLAEYKQLGVERMPKKEAVEILANAGYQVINQTLLRKKTVICSNSDYARLIYYEPVEKAPIDLDYSGEDKDDPDEEDAPADSKNLLHKYDYLLDMKYSSALKENILRLEQQLEATERELEVISPPGYYKILWKQEMYKLLDVYLRRDQIIDSYLPKIKK